LQIYLLAPELRIPYFLGYVIFTNTRVEDIHRRIFTDTRIKKYHKKTIKNKNKKKQYKPLVI
jgi:hypothetical protein